MTDEPEPDAEPRTDRRRWLIAAVGAVVVFALLTVATVMIAGGGSSSEVEFLPGRTIEVPNDLADLDRRDALVAILDGVAGAAGYTDEFRDCVADEIEGLSDPELAGSAGPGEQAARTDQLLAASGDCERTVDAVVAPEATPEQIDFLRALTAKQIGDLVGVLPENVVASECVPDRIRAMSDEEVRRLVDELGASIERLEQQCRPRR